MRVVCVCVWRGGGIFMVCGPGEGVGGRGSVVVCGSGSLSLTHTLSDLHVHHVPTASHAGTHKCMRAHTAAPALCTYRQLKP